METNKFNPYVTLGLPNDPEIPFTKIKKQFNKLSILYHPDKNAFSDEDCSDKFQDILKAYKILSDTNKRKKFHMEYPSEHHQLKYDIKSYLQKLKSSLKRRTEFGKEGEQFKINEFNQTFTKELNKINKIYNFDNIDSQYDTVYNELPTTAAQRRKQRVNVQVDNINQDDLDNDIKKRKNNLVDFMENLKKTNPDLVIPKIIENYDQVDFNNKFVNFVLKNCQVVVYETPLPYENTMDSNFKSISKNEEQFPNNPLKPMEIKEEDYDSNILDVNSFLKNEFDDLMKGKRQERDHYISGLQHKQNDVGQINRELNDDLVDIGKLVSAINTHENLNSYSDIYKAFERLEIQIKNIRLFLMEFYKKFNNQNTMFIHDINIFNIIHKLNREKISKTIQSSNEFNYMIQHNHNSNSDYLIVNKALLNLNNLYKHQIKTLKTNVLTMIDSFNDPLDIINLEFHVYETMKLLKNIHQNIIYNWELFIRDVEKIC